MITGISGVTTAAVGGASSPTVTAAVAQPVASKAASAGGSSSGAKPDTVKISKAAQARSLKRQGHTMADIANRLKVDPKTVASYLK